MLYSATPTVNVKGGRQLNKHADAIMDAPDVLDDYCKFFLNSSGSERESSFLYKALYIKMVHKTQFTY